MKWTNEAKVGVLVLGTATIGVVFAWLVGVQNPFSAHDTLYVTYNFAGGVDVGSPVRLSGIKVGKVEAVDFFAPETNATVATQEPGSADTESELARAPVRLKISIKKQAMKGIRKDSRFYINLAGIIGERYIEITPGTLKGELVKTGDTAVGVDPPRIDQLISQSFDLAGKIIDLVEKNKGDITRTIELLAKLSAGLNKTLEKLDRSKIVSQDLGKLITNLMELTEDVRIVTKKARSPEAEKTLNLLHELLWRLEPVDGERIRTFFQKEGMRVKFF